jgi:hypothetical protein
MNRGIEILRLKVAPSQAARLATAKEPPAQDDPLAPIPVVGPDGLICPAFVSP